MCMNVCMCVQNTISVESERIPIFERPASPVNRCVRDIQRSAMYTIVYYTPSVSQASRRSRR